MKFMFEVYCERHKTVEIEANSRDDAYDELLDQLYDIDMDDACESNDRWYELLKDD